MTRHVEPPPRYIIFTQPQPVITGKPEAYRSFGGKLWISSFGNYLVEKRGSDLLSVVHVGVGRMQSTYLTAGWGSGQACLAANARMVRLTNHAARSAYRTVAGSSFGTQHTYEPAHPPNHLPVTVARRSAGHFSSADGICVFTAF